MIKPIKKIKLWRVQYPVGTLAKMTDIQERLGRRDFQPIDDFPDETRSKGFVSFMDCDESVNSESLNFGSWALFAFREDIRKPDAKTLNRRLEKMIKRKEKAGEHVGKELKRDMKEQLALELTRNAEPIPSLTPVYVHPEEDAIYYPVATEKKLDAITIEVEQALDLPEGERLPSGFDEEAHSLWLEKLWLDSWNGNGPEFVAMSVGNDESVTRSDDDTDLAFGRLNSKRCKSGKLDLGSVTAEIAANPECLGLEINLESGESPEDDLVTRLDLIADAFAKVRGMRDEFSPGDTESQFTDECRKQIEII